MLTQFLSYIKKNHLVLPHETLLIATSGGIDSMVLVDLCIKGNIKIAIAHLNHNLRGAEALEDEHFLTSFCTKNNIPCHIESLDIGQMVTEEKANMHQLARRERYSFFNKIIQEFKYEKLATAHHKDDLIEGFFINLFRGAGLKGLSGISKAQNNLVRPLLFMDKEAIRYYANKNKIAFREDSSNASTKYQRNHIRHKLIPIIEQIKPQYQKTISSSIQKINASQQLLSYYILGEQEKYKTITNDGCIIQLDKMRNIPGNTTLLYHLILDYHFTSSQVESMIIAIDHTGALFHSTTHRGLINRQELIIKSNIIRKKENYQININENIKIGDLGIISIFDKQSKTIDKNNTIQLNINKLEFPLTIRKWQAGDRFQPKGMNGQSKKIKKYLTDIKMNRFEKDNTYVMTSNGKICWLIGLRLDERFVGEGVFVQLN